MGYDVVLSGDGGDEMLSVSPYCAADFLARLDLKGVYEQCRIGYQSYRLSAWQMLWFLWRFAVRPIPVAAGRRLLRTVAPGLLAARWRRQQHRHSPVWFAPEPGLKREIDDRRDAALDRQLEEEDRHGFYLSSIRDVLGNSARCAGLEETFESSQRLGIRELQPFWDADLVALLLRTPPDLLSANGRSKGLVRQTVARRFPELGFERQKKVMFTNFFRNLLLEEGSTLWRAMRKCEALVDLGIVDATELNSTMDALFSGQAPEQIIYLWDVFNVEAWLRARI
jgi:asparagine synthetase B (glutamine-hydrolysing)